MTIAEKSERYYARTAKYWGTLEHVSPGEELLLQQFHGQWGRMSMLDIGIGGGRTTRLFSPITGHYVGIDSVKEMIEEARSTVKQDERVEIRVGDARDLSGFGASRFDVVLFSYNGIDHVDFVERARVFKEVHRVLRPGGTFLFSTHCLRVLVPRLCPMPFRRKLQYIFENPRLFLTRNEDREFAVVQEEGEPILYVDPFAQRRRLIELGFSPTRVTDRGGRAIDLEQSRERERWGREHWWIHYQSIAVK